MTKSRCNARGWGKISFSVLISINDEQPVGWSKSVQAIMSMSMTRSA